MGTASKAITLALLGTGATIVGVSALGPGRTPQPPQPQPSDLYAGDGTPAGDGDWLGTTRPTTGPATQALAGSHGTPGHGGTHTYYGGYGSPGYRYRTGYAPPQYGSAYRPGTTAPPPPAGQRTGSSTGSGSSSPPDAGSSSSTSSGTSRGGFGSVGHSSSSSSSSS